MTRHGPFLVALTGGIASGKSAVAEEFAALGVEIVDTDVIAREVVAPGSALLEELKAQFGSSIIGADGQLDRRALRARVFANPLERERLEALLHPAIRKEALRRIAACRSAYCVLVIPLLAETGGFPGVVRVLLVEANARTRLQRLMRRDRVDRTAAQAALDAQASDAQRRAIADDLIDNSGSLSALREKVAELHRRYLALAASPDDVDVGAAPSPQRERP